jgi:isocitrate dehydrogenase
MKHTDGLFHEVFKEIASDYPEIEAENWIIDIGAARLADTPEMFEVVVMPNLYGDVVSDIAAQISGSVGLGGSANIGEECAMFEAIHGSAPDIAGKNIANPSGLLRAAVMMLNHIGHQDVAEKVKNAWSCTIEQGIHTADIYKENISKQKVGTKEFAEAIISNLGQKPKTLEAVEYAKELNFKLPVYKRKPPKKKTLKGVDVFVDWKGTDPEELAMKLQKLNGNIKLSMITNRGVKVWPEGFPETFCTDHWRCRYETENGHEVSKESIPALMSKAIEQDVDIIKTENLYDFDGDRGYSLGQGQ